MGYDRRRELVVILLHRFPHPVRPVWLRRCETHHLINHSQSWYTHMCVKHWCSQCYRRSLVVTIETTTALCPDCVQPLATGTCVYAICVWLFGVIKCTLNPTLYTAQLLLTLTGVCIRRRRYTQCLSVLCSTHPQLATPFWPIT